jgi:hypothetical protein
MQSFQYIHGNIVIIQKYFKSYVFELRIEKQNGIMNK